MHRRPLGQEWLADGIPRLLRNWRLTDGTHATVTGIVLFGRDLRAVLPSANLGPLDAPELRLAAPEGFSTVSAQVEHRYHLVKASSALRRSPGSAYGLAFGRGRLACGQPWLTRH